MQRTLRSPTFPGVAPGGRGRGHGLVSVAGRITASARWLASMLLVVLLLVLARPVAADEPVRIFVLREHGVTTVALAQPYLDRFVALAAAQNGWRAAQGSYLTSRAAAEEAIRRDRPRYAILSLPAFLALRVPQRLEVIGRVEVSLSGGRRYHLISRHATDLAGCKGKPLATDHAADVRFLERVVARGQFALSDFQLRATRRPLQTTRQVLEGQAECALVDDVQLAELAHLSGAEGVRAVWGSAELPQMVVAALPEAPKAEREAFRANLPKLCTEEGRAICAEVGIVALTASSFGDYADLVTAYGD